MPLDNGRFRKLRTRRKGKLIMYRWLDLMTGHHFVIATKG